MRRSKCRGRHAWMLKRTREVCVDCGAVFPCAGRCDHIDCRLAKGDDEPPPGVIYVE